jgi:DNA-binding CsgD family transcriptional regulator/N-acetylneuraminic acid mutarotase
MSSTENELSEREQEILRLVATGASNKEIALRLFISTNTVKVHLRNIFGKIGVASRTEAAMYAVNRGLINEQAPGKLLVTSSQPMLDNHPELGMDASKSLESVDLKLAPRTILGLSLEWFIADLLGLLLIAVAVIFFFASGIIASSLATPTPTEASRWRSLTSLPTARFSLAVVGYENDIYALGGKTSQGVTGVVEYYDIAANRWLPAAAKPTPVFEIGAVVIGGEIFVPGGRLSSGEVTNVLEIYNPRDDSWAQGAPLPAALSAYALVAYEGRMYLFGGWDGFSFVNSVFVYDPVQDVWNRKPTMPTARGYLGGAMAGRKIYLIGGYDGREALSVNEVFQPDLADEQGESWSVAAPLPVAKYAIGTTSLADIIFIFGGFQGDDDNRNYGMLQYVPQTDDWRTINAPSVEIGASFGVTNEGTDIFAIGGLIGQQPLANNLIYSAIYTISFPIIVK